MRWQHNISVCLLILGCRVAVAQDSLSAGLQEQLSPVTQLRDGIYASPSLRAWQRQYNYSQIGASYRKYEQDLYQQQEGSGQRIMAIHSETYLRQNATTTLWGQASYNNRRLEKVRFNETSDYHLVYPYVTSDTVGGYMKAESYAFQAGIAKVAGIYQLALQGGYRGEQAYRDRDPRPRNTTSTIDLQLSASRRIGSHYNLALDIGGTKYNQNSSLSFVSELGSPMVYQEAGLGAFNELLKGTGTSGNLAHTYNGLGYQASLHLAPRQYKGVFARAMYKHFNIGKFRSDIIDELSTSKEKAITGIVGYLKETATRHILVQVMCTQLLKDGVESKFILGNPDSGNVMRLYKLAEELRYTHDYTELKARSVYGRTGGTIDWYAGFEAGYVNSIQKYVMPNRELSYRHWLAGIDLTASKTFRTTRITLAVQAQRQENIDATGYWPDLTPDKAHYHLLTSNLAYLSASRTIYGGSLRADFPLSDKLGGTIRLDGARQTGIGSNDLSATIAVRF